MKAVLIGEKLGHSFSAEIHTKLGVDYSLCEVERSNLENFAKTSKLDFYNVTIPYKKEIMPYLDCIDEKAKQIGAVNTVINKNGKKWGYNTDYYGFKSLLEKNKVIVKDKSVLILGTGGTKETATQVLKDLGAKNIRVVSRNGEINYTNCYFSDTNIIVNTTPVGMFPKMEMVDIDLEKFPSLEVVADCIYNPLNTKLVLKAKTLGINAFGGLYMLVSQAVWANKLVNDNLDISVTNDIYKELLAKKQNITLIGMPSSGKTTIGKLLAEITGKEFIDTDELIVQKYGDIPKIFAEFGEEKFREYETEIIREVSSKTNAIISTGGGAVLRKENIVLLKQNSKIVFIDRDIFALEFDGRPLSKDRETLIKMKKIRQPIYESVCDYKVVNDKNPKEIAKSIKEIIYDFSY